MKVNILYIVIFLFITFIVVDKILQNKQKKEFTEQIDNLKEEADSLRTRRTYYYKEIDSLDNIIVMQDFKIDSLNKMIDSIKTIRNEVPDNVIDMDERELDSILTNYRHPKGN